MRRAATCTHSCSSCFYLTSVLSNCFYLCPSTSYFLGFCPIAPFVYVMLVQQRWAHLGIFIGIFTVIFSREPYKENLLTLPTGGYFWNYQVAHFYLPVHNPSPTTLSHSPCSLSHSETSLLCNFCPFHLEQWVFLLTWRYFWWFSLHCQYSYWFL